MDVSFLLDKTLLEASNQEHLVDSLLSSGYRVILDVHHQLGENVVPGVMLREGCAVAYGSIRFVESKTKGCQSTPGAYYSRDRYKCTHYMTRMPMDLLANGNGIYLPFGELERKHNEVYRLFGVSRLFVRPDSGAKVFTGLVIEQDAAAFELKSLMSLTSVTTDTLVLIAPAQSISVEYRFFIVEGMVVTGSQYMRDGMPEVSQDVDSECLAAAERVAGLPWQIDLAYACDIGLIDGVPKLIELNAFSTSGLYACNGKALFEAVAHAAWREYNGEISIVG